MLLVVRPPCEPHEDVSGGVCSRRERGPHGLLSSFRCEHFRSSLGDNEDDIVEMSEFSYPVYRAFLEYLYTDSISLSPEEAVGNGPRTFPAGGSVHGSRGCAGGRGRSSLAGRHTPPFSLVTASYTGWLGGCHSASAVEGLPFPRN